MLCSKCASAQDGRLVAQALEAAQSQERGLRAVEAQTSMASMRTERDGLACQVEELRLLVQEQRDKKSTAAEVVTSPEMTSLLARNAELTRLLDDAEHRLSSQAPCNQQYSYSSARFNSLAPSLLLSILHPIVPNSQTPSA